MQTALESEGQAAEAGAVGTALRAGVTVDLSRKGIQKLPEEVIDIVKDQLERYASFFSFYVKHLQLTDTNHFCSSGIVDLLCRTTNCQVYRLDFPNARLCGT